MKRVFLIVLDSCGIGEMPDAENFGDKDCNTLKRISQSEFFSAENSIKMGLSLIDGVNYLPENNKPIGAFGRIAEKSMGKDTTIGHWEIAGIVSEIPLPVYPDGFPREVIDEFSKRTGRKIICNKPYSGTEVIKDYGKEHIETGSLIVYTSADSVFQIAAHEKTVPVETLYEYCETARKILCGIHSVGRVIARPFSGEYPNFYRTANRRDFSLTPPRNTVLDALKNTEKSVVAVGKISDIFASRGVTEKIITHSNAEGMDALQKILKQDFEGLCFVNLVDFDMLYGHRQDVDGYAKAFSEFDRRIPSFIDNMKDDDIMMITADHGCDPGDSHTDHSREYVPLLICGKKIKPVNLKTRKTFSDIGASIADYFGIPFECDGTSFIDIILKGE